MVDQCKLKRLQPGQVCQCTQKNLACAIHVTVHLPPIRAANDLTRSNFHNPPNQLYVLRVQASFTSIVCLLYPSATPLSRAA